MQAVGICAGEISIRIVQMTANSDFTQRLALRPTMKEIVNVLILFRQKADARSGGFIHRRYALFPVLAEAATYYISADT